MKGYGGKMGSQCATNAAMQKGGNPHGDMGSRTFSGKAGGGGKKKGK